MSIAMIGDEEPSNLQNWSVNDVCKWFAGLGLSQDYSSKIEELAIDGQVLMKFSSTYLVGAMSILDSEDQSTLSQALNAILKTGQTPPSSSSPSPSACICSPALKTVPSSPKAFQFPSGKLSVALSDQDSSTRNYLMTNIKAKSLDELLNETVMFEAGKLANHSVPHQSHLFEVIRAENVSLKKKLECYYERVLRLQKLELELQQLQDSYSLLEGTSNRKAKLEKAIRERLEEELLRMKQTQAQQKAELHSIKRTTSGTVVGSNDVGADSIQDHVGKRDKEIVIEKLLQQNEEAILLRQKLESNLLFTKSTLEDNTCTSVKRKSEPEPYSRRKASKGSSDHEKDIASVLMTNLEGLQSLLTAMQTSSDNRQRLEQQLRKQLQDRVEELEAGIDSHKEQTEDQELRIATLKADLAQMEEKCAELLAEKQLAMNETRQSQVSLLEYHCTTKEEELKTVKLQRDRCMVQLDEAHQTIAKQEKRIYSLEAAVKEKQSLLDRLQMAHQFRHDESLYHNGLDNKFKSVINGPNGTVSSHCIRRKSSPLPPYSTAGTIFTATPTINQISPPTTVNPPTLPSYDEHLHTTRYSHQYLNHSPVSNYQNETSSHSFPNTPETVRRRVAYTGTAPSVNSFYTSPAGRSCSGSSLVPTQGTGEIYKSLTPPPVHYPPKPCPTLITSHSLSHNGGLTVSRHDAFNADSDSVDSFELLLNSSSPASLSPPTRYQIGRNGFGTSSSYIHEHSSSFPYSLHK